NARTEPPHRGGGLGLCTAADPLHGRSARARGDSGRAVETGRRDDVHLDVSAPRRRGRGMTRARVLVVDDEPDMVDNCVRILGRTDSECAAANDPRRALDLVESERPDVILTDLKMPGMDGMALLRRARELDPALPVIVVTAFATIESAVAAIKEGA